MLLQGYSYDRTVVGQTVRNADHVWEGHRLRTDRTKWGNQVLVTAHATPTQPIVDISWLKAAAEVYDISPDPKDYVFAEVPGCQADLPNRNLDCFAYNELVKFRPILGRVAYKSFTAKMCSQDHDNQDPLRAKGACFDSSLQQIRGHYHVKVVSGWCRQKDASLAKRILENRAAGYSMACLIGHATCSVCGFMSKGQATCRHIRGGLGKGTIWKGQLVFDLLHDLNFWELAHVEDKADIDANQDWAQ